MSLNRARNVATAGAYRWPAGWRIDAVSPHARKAAKNLRVENVTRIASL
jgi:hypothetical protein